MRPKKNLHFSPSSQKYTKGSCSEQLPFSFFLGVIENSSIWLVFVAVLETKWVSAVFGFDYLPLKNVGLSTFVAIA